MLPPSLPSIQNQEQHPPDPLLRPATHSERPFSLASHRLSTSSARLQPQLQARKHRACPSSHLAAPPSTPPRVDLLRASGPSLPPSPRISLLLSLSRSLSLNLTGSCAPGGRPRAAKPPDGAPAAATSRSAVQPVRRRWRIRRSDPDLRREPPPASCATQPPRSSSVPRRFCVQICPALSSRSTSAPCVDPHPSRVPPASPIKETSRSTARPASLPLPDPSPPSLAVDPSPAVRPIRRQALRRAAQRLAPKLSHRAWATAQCPLQPLCRKPPRQIPGPGPW